MIEESFPFILEIFLHSYIIRGLIYTLTLAFLSLAIGFFIGVLCAIGRVYGPRYLAWIIEAYVSFIRGTPMVVHLFLVYYSLPSVGIRLDGSTAALLVFSLVTGAWQSEYFRGAIQSVSSGQMMAAEALGFSKLGSLRHVVLPQALRFALPFALPAWSNEGVYQLKATAIVFTIGVMDLTSAGLILNSIYARPFEIFFVVGVLYILMVYTFSKSILLLRKKYKIPGFR